MMNNVMACSIILFSLLSFSHGLCAEEQLNKAPSVSGIEETQQPNLLDGNEPLPIDAKIMALLESSESQPLKTASLLPKMNSISQNFNIAEKYLMLIIRANLILDKAEIHKAINWLNKAILLEDKIAYAQLIQPEFNQIHLNLAKRYVQLAQFKLAYEQKNKYLDKYRDYRKRLREQRLAKLNAKYETDLKVKTNELLKTQHEFQNLQLQEAENAVTVQKRNIGILLITAIIFAILLVRQLKINTALKRSTELDDSTRLLNRQALFEQAENLVELSINLRHDISTILLNVDHLKDINEQYGYSIGDQVITEIAKLSKETIRPRDILARIGDEEFSVILPQTNHEQAKAIAERLREKVEHINFSPSSDNISITISLGVASLSQSHQNFDALMNAADQALLLAKNKGRNQVCSYIKQDY